MPCFEGLFDAKDWIFIRKLLYLTASLHTYIRFRLQTDETLTTQLELTEKFGDALRLFHINVCAKYATKELDHERQKRARQELNAHTQAQPGKTQKTLRSPAEKSFSMVRPKIHFTADYIRTTLEVGTPDSYSSATVRRLAYS